MMHNFLLGLSLNYVAYTKEFRPRIHGHGLKSASSCCLSVSEEAKLEVDTTSIILSYLYHFGNANKQLFIYC